MNYSVYKHESPSNKVYIGITCKKPEYRWNSGRGYWQNPHFTAAIQKYGWENFSHEILFTGLSKEEAEAKEIELIALYDATNRERGYNHELGGNAKGKTTEETRRKISESRKGKATGENHPMYGKHLSAEHKRKLSEAHKGKKLSEETLRKRSESTRGEKSCHYGKHHSEETKRKISMALKNRPPMSEATRKKIGDSERGEKHWTAKRGFTKTHRKRLGEAHKKPVLCVETGVIYGSAKDAGEQLGINKGNISLCCTGRRKTAGGFHWQHATQQISCFTERTV